MADAFDKFKSSFNRGIATISVKTSSSIEKSRLKTHIESLNKEVQSLYYQIGEAGYMAWTSGEDNREELEKLMLKVKEAQDTVGQLTVQLNSIDQRDNEILGTKEEKPVLSEGSVICPKCGASFDTPVKFCRNCGFKMQE